MSYAASYYSLRLPLYQGYPDEFRWVAQGSPLKLRRAVYTLARYFRREGQFDFIPYGFEGRESDRHAAAFLLEEQADRSGYVHAIGAGCFRLREEGRCLQWVWMHPFHRGEGRLSRCWPAFEERFPGFLVEGPLSPAMRHFLKQRGEEWRLSGPASVTRGYSTRFPTRGASS